MVKVIKVKFEKNYLNINWVLRKRNLIVVKVMFHLKTEGLNNAIKNWKGRVKDSINLKHL